MEAVIGLSPSPQGFGIAALTARVGEITGLSYQSHGRLRTISESCGKGFMHKVEHTRCWEATAVGLKTMAGIVVLREKVIKPLLAGIIGQPGRNPRIVGLLSPTTRPSDARCTASSRLSKSPFESNDNLLSFGFG